MITLRIGLISDTHGLLRPQALEALKNVDLILHAGDIGKPEIIETLCQIAPVDAIRGNNDTAAWAQALPETLRIDAGGLAVYMLHDLKALTFDPRESGIRIVVAGHSHRPSISEEHGVLFINPGSAGPRRFRLPVSVGHLDIAAGVVRPSIHPLDV